MSKIIEELRAIRRKHESVLGASDSWTIAWAIGKLMVYEKQRDEIERLNAELARRNKHYAEIERLQAKVEELALKLSRRKLGNAYRELATEQGETDDT